MLACCLSFCMLYLAKVTDWEWLESGWFQWLKEKSSHLIFNFQCMVSVCCGAIYCSHAIHACSECPLALRELKYIAWHAHYASSVGPPSQLFHVGFWYYFNIRASCLRLPFWWYQESGQRGQQQATAACVWVLVTFCLSLWCECFCLLRTFLVLWRKGKAGFVFHTAGCYKNH